MLRTHRIAKVLIAAFTATAAADALGQMNNAPFSFSRSGSTGIGMSQGGRQAILDEKIFGSRPSNMLRSPSGFLLDVYEAPGKSALVAPSGTLTFIPQYRGMSALRPDMSAGVFNPFYSKEMYYSGVAVGGPVSSGATVSTWTGRVTTGVPVSYGSESNEVDTWTAQAMGM